MLNPHRLRSNCRSRHTLRHPLLRCSYWSLLCLFCMNFHDLRFSVVNVETYVAAVVCQVSCSPLDMLETMSHLQSGLHTIFLSETLHAHSVGEGLPCMLICSRRLYRGPWLWWFPSSCWSVRYSFFDQLSLLSRFCFLGNFTMRLIFHWLGSVCVLPSSAWYPSVLLVHFLSFQHLCVYLVTSVLFYFFRALIALMPFSSVGLPVSITRTSSVELISASTDGRLCWDEDSFKEFLPARELLFHTAFQFPIMFSDWCFCISEASAERFADTA